jgi:outer membrane lipoprotein-sorting protein
MNDPLSDIKKRLERFRSIEPSEHLETRFDSMLESEGDFQMNTNHPYTTQRSWWSIFSAPLRLKPALTAAVVVLIVLFALMQSNQMTMAQSLEKTYKAIQSIKTMANHVYDIKENGEEVIRYSVWWQSPDWVRVDYNKEYFKKEDHILWSKGDETILFDRTYQVAQQFSQSETRLPHIQVVREIVDRWTHPDQAKSLITQISDDIEKQPDKEYLKVVEDSVTRHQIVHKTKGIIYQLIIDNDTNLPLEDSYNNGTSERGRVIYEWNTPFEEGWFDANLPKGVVLTKLGQADDSEDTGGNGLVVGSVTDPAGVPIADVNVMVRYVREIFLTHTDTNGRYALAIPRSLAIKAPDWNRKLGVIFRAPGFAMDYVQVDRDQFFPQYTQDITLQHGGVVSGKVVDESNNPIAGVEVKSRHQSQRKTFFPLKVYTDENGEFTLYGFNSNQEEYKVAFFSNFHQEVNFTAHKKGSEIVPDTDQIVQTYTFDEQPIVLNRGYHRPLVVLDANGDPIPEVLIVSNPPRTMYGDGIPTDRDGKLNLSGHDQPECEILIWKEGHALHKELVDLEKTEPLVISLAQATPISGQFIGADGNQLSGIELSASIDNTIGIPNPWRLRVSSDQITQPDETGAFTLQAVSSKTHINLGFKQMGTQEKLAVTNLHNVPLSLYENQPLMIDPTSRGTLRGTLRQISDGQNVNCFFIYIKRYHANSDELSDVFFEDNFISNANGKLNIPFDNNPYPHLSDRVFVQIYKLNCREASMNMKLDYREMYGPEPPWEGTFTLEELEQPVDIQL